MLWWLIGYAIVAAMCGLLGAYVAAEKGRSPAEGGLFGALLGPFGVIAVGLLPTVEAAPRRAETDEPRQSLARPAMRIPAEKKKEDGVDPGINW